MITRQWNLVQLSIYFTMTLFYKCCVYEVQMNMSVLSV